MGCNRSKQKDVTASRTRGCGASPALEGNPRSDHQASAKQSKPLTMPTNASRSADVPAEESVGAMGATPSDSRMKENEDFYQMLVTGYEGDAIDVKSDREMHMRPSIDEYDSPTYEGLDHIPVSRRVLPLVQLPVPAEGLDLSNLLAKSAADAESKSKILAAVASLAAVLGTVRVQNEDSPIQAFPEMPSSGGMILNSSTAQ